MPVTQNKTQEETPMNTFVPFTAARKNMIITTKAMLTDPKNLKIDRNHYGNRIPHLFFQDYLVYAVMRGADFKKASHEDSLDMAKQHLKWVVDSLDSYLKDKTSYSARKAARYLPAEEGEIAAAELKALIEEALAVAKTGA
jgi:hypothetical protein